MDHASEETSKISPLMSYRLEKGKRMLLRIGLLCAVLLAGGILVMLLFGPFTLSHLSVALVFLLILGWMIRFYVRAVIGFQCTNSALEITMALGRIETIEWAEVRLFKKKRKYAVLESGDHPAFYFIYIPDDILHGLASILRETTKARVLGFGGEP